MKAKKNWKDEVWTWQEYKDFTGYQTSQDEITVSIKEIQGRKVYYFPHAKSTGVLGYSTPEERIFVEEKDYPDEIYMAIKERISALTCHPDLVNVGIKDVFARL